MRLTIAAFSALLFACGSSAELASDAGHRAAHDSGSPLGDGGGVAPDDAGTVGSPDGGIPTPEPSVPSACGTAASGRAWVVAVDGDDAGDGTEESPLFTIQLAVSRARPGDEILLREGRYGAERRIPFRFGSCGDDVAWALIAIDDVSDYCTDERERHQYEVADGTPEAPITIRSYPGEHAILDGTGLSRAIDIGVKAHWTIADLEIVGATVNIWGGNRSGNPHHISFCGNTFHAMRENDALVSGKNNVGMIRIDRGDWGGAHDIFIEGNEFYDFAERNAEWHDSESLHIAAITTLSCLPYIDPDCGGTGAIYIRNNLIHEVPSPFFFKNPAPGPIEITGNVIYHAQTLGHAAAANGLVERNLIYDVGAGFNLGGGSVAVAAIAEHHGRAWTFRHNTFVGLSTVANVWHFADHRFEGNLFFGVGSSVDGANWDTPSLIRKTEHAIHREPMLYDALDPADSVLATIEAAANCIVASNERYVHAKRILSRDATGTETRIEHYTLEEARETFGMDLDSTRVVSTDASSVFVDPDGADFHVLEGHPCESAGVYARTPR